MGTLATLLLLARPIHRIQKKQVSLKCELDNAMRSTMANSKSFSVWMKDFVTKVSFTCFEAVNVIVAYKMEMGEPLFDI